MGSLPHEAAERFPGKPALIFGETVWTYEQVEQDAGRIAQSLRLDGVRKGDRVAPFLANCPELVMSYYACFKIGAIAVPLNNHYKGVEIAYAVAHAGATVLISQDHLFPEVASVRPQLGSIESYYLVGQGAIAGVRCFAQLLDGSQADFSEAAIAEDDPAVILYTSGTTSKPKGVVHTHASLVSTAVNQATTRQVDHREISLVTLPICHIAGFAGQILTTALAAGTVVLMPGFEPSSLLAAIERHRPTTLQLLPPSLADILNHPKAVLCHFGSLRCCIVGGDRVPVSVQKRFRDCVGLEVTETCGMTESFSYAMNPPHGEKRLGSIGRPVHDTRLRLVDDTGREVATGSVGEILVASGANMWGYWADPTETAKVLQGGWIHTGDLARVDEDGYYWFAGRMKDIITVAARTSRHLR